MRDRHGSLVAVAERAMTFRGHGAPSAIKAEDSKFLAQVNDQHHGHCDRAQLQTKGNYNRVIVEDLAAQVSRRERLVAYTFVLCPVTVQRGPEDWSGSDHPPSCRSCTVATWVLPNHITRLLQIQPTITSAARSPCVSVNPPHKSTSERFTSSAKTRCETSPWPN